MMNETPPISTFEATELRNGKFYLTKYWFLFLQKLFEKVYNPLTDIQSFSSTPVSVKKEYQFLDIDTTTGAITANLPTASKIKGKEIIFKNTGVNILTIDGNGAETIDGSATLVLSLNQYVKIISNGTNWLRIG